MKKWRILTGSIFQETHSFNPIITPGSDFFITRGPESLSAITTPVTLGIVSAAGERNVELVPTVSAFTRPGGPVEQAIYNELKEEILRIAGASGVDGVALDLHGAMQTEEADDAEGDLLSALRKVVGERVPIAVGLDLHSHITRRMLECADICTGYKENPHSDTFETGRRTLFMLLNILEGKKSYSTAMGKVPMITRGRDETTEGALKALWDHTRELKGRHGSIEDISIFNVQHFLDAEELGQTVLVITDGDPETARTVCTDLCERLWKIRDDVVATFPSIEETIDTIVRHPEGRPYVIGDIGDRIIAGAPGDSTAILQYLLDHNLSLRAAIPITDPGAVEKACSAGLGAEIELQVGGAFSPSFKPVSISGKVTRITDNETTEEIIRSKSKGKTVVFQAGTISLLLSVKSNIVMFPESFTTQGIEINGLDLLIAKSGNHFKIFFEKIATPLSADTPGLTVFRPESFPFKKGRPIYPLDTIDYRPDTPLLFRARNQSG